MTSPPEKTDAAATLESEEVSKSKTMVDHDMPKTLPQAGEPGTIAVTVDRPKIAHATYHADQSGDPPKLRVQDLSVTYIDRKGNETEAVRDVSFDVYDKPDSGEIIVFLGPSGCGKSTILKAVAGLLPPTKGQCLVDGKVVTDVGRDRGMVFQTYTSFGWLTVRENVEYGLKLHGTPKAERQQISDKILKSIGLAEFADRLPKDLSGGKHEHVSVG